MKTFSITPEKMTYLALLSGTVFLVFVLLFIITPTIKKIISVSDNITDIKNYMEEKFERARQLHKNTLRLPEIKSEVEKWNRAIIKKDDYLDIIKFFEAAALENNVAIKLSPTPLKKTDGVLKTGIELNIQASGNFQNIMNFVALVDESDYYVDFDEMKIQRATSGPAITAAQDLKQIVFAELKGKFFTYEK